MLLFVKYGPTGRIHVVSTPSPTQWVDNAMHGVYDPADIPRVVGRHPGDPDGYADFLTRFAKDLDRTTKTYADTPELRAWVAAAPEAREGASAVGRPVTFGDDVAVDIWRQAWTGEETDTQIARRYGVSAALVSQIARGDARKHLFKTRVEDGWVYVSLANGGREGEEYRYRNGGRRK